MSGIVTVKRVDAVVRCRCGEQLDLTLDQEIEVGDIEGYAHAEAEDHGWGPSGECARCHAATQRDLADMRRPERWEP